MWVKETEGYRNAVEAANAASSWSKSTAHLRAQILYFLGENLSIRADEFAVRISEMTGDVIEKSKEEVQSSIERLFSYAAWADKYDGAAHGAPIRGIALAMNEPVGTIGMICLMNLPTWADFLARSRSCHGQYLYCCAIRTIPSCCH